MPHSDLHKKKKKKNLLILALIIGFIAVIWMITMIKLAHADEGGYNPADYDGLKAKRVVDQVTSYLDEREAHLQSQKGVDLHWWYDELVPGTAFNMGGRLVDGGNDGMTTTVPVKLDNERRLHNTFDHNRNIGGVGTITQ